MKTTIKTLLLFALLVCGAELKAQVTVILQQPPAFQFKIENMWKVTLINTTLSTTKVYLKGLATARIDGQIVEVTTSTFDLPRGTKIINARELAPLKVNERNSKYSDVVKKIGGVPTGDYDICVSVFNAETNALLGEMCVQSQVLNLTQLQLMQPAQATIFDMNPKSGNAPQKQQTNDERFAARLNKIGRTKTDAEIVGVLEKSSAEHSRGGQLELVRNATKVTLVGGLIPFSWLPPAPLPQGVRVSYRLQIAEINPKQSAYDAMRANPKLVVLEKLQTNLVVLPIAARRLLPNRWYSWKVDVFLDNKIIQESEVFSFSMTNGEHPPKGQVGDCPPTCPCWPPDQVTPNISYHSPTDGTSTKDNVYSNSGYSSIPVFNSMHNGQSNYSKSMNNQRLSPVLTGRNLLPSFMNEFHSIVDPDTSESGSSGEPPFQIIGGGRIEYQNASRVATFSEVPKNYLTASLNPGLKLFGLPFSTNILYTTQQDTSRQSINQFGLNFDFNTMREGLANRLQQAVEKKIESAAPMSEDELSEIRNPNNLMDNLKEHASVSGMEQFFMSIRTLGIGTNYPSYSDHILSGVPVTGLNMELNPGIFYTAFTASNNQRALDNAAFQRDLYAGRIGLGTKDASHFILTGMYVSDNAESIRIDSSNQTLTPRENTVFGIDAKVDLFDNQLTLETEGAVSLLTRDTRDADFTSDAIPSFLTSIVSPRLSSSVDFMYAGKLTYSNEESATNISAGVKMIGPGYASLGVPLLRNDQFIYEAKLDQKLFDNRVSLGSFFRSAFDNLITWKAARTTMSSIGVNLGFNFPNLPFVQISFSPTQQKNDASDTLSRINNNLLIYSGITGYTFIIGETSFSTTLSVNGQETKTMDGSGNFNTRSYMIGEALSFSLPLTVAVNFGVIQMQSPLLGNRIIHNIELNGSAPIGESISIGGGANYAAEHQQNERIGFFANSSMQVTNAITFDARIEKTTFNEFILSSGNYGEFLMTIGIQTRW